MVDDLAAGSSPTRATAPPAGCAPERLACRSASLARSTPGDLPYQKPVTPSTRLSARVPASWLP